MTTSTFIPGLELSRRSYLEAVHPVLDEAAPEMAHSAALLDSGTEVLGFDTARSADHGWGPRLQIFLTSQDAIGPGERLSALSTSPVPVRWSTAQDPAAGSRPLS